MRKRLWYMVAGGVLAAALCAGCAAGHEEEVFEEDPDAGYRRTVLYYLSDTGFIVPVMKRIPWEEGIGKAALGYLVGTPANEASAAGMGLKTIVPEGAGFSLRIGEDGAAALDITGLTELADAALEQAMITSLVNTLTEFDSISTVSITIDGAKVKALPHGTGLDTAMAALPLNVEDSELAVSSDSAHALTLYFPNQNAGLNIPVTRYVAADPTFAAAVEELIAGPGSAALRNCFPEGTALRSAYIDSGVAYVDVTKEYLAVAQVDGLSAAALNAICLTANALEPVYGVDLYVEGEPYSLHAGQVSASVYVNEFR
ncbi:MAG: GerMN domain-containing protein [Christensenellaceae bacterium]|jgi:germination protein M|nr:GerMN domain-containing protein [Christensenellaceae bacterium]